MRYVRMLAALPAIVCAFVLISTAFGFYKDARIPGGFAERYPMAMLALGAACVGLALLLSPRAEDVSASHLQRVFGRWFLVVGSVCFVLMYFFIVVWGGE